MKEDRGETDELMTEAATQRTGMTVQRSAAYRTANQTSVLREQASLRRVDLPPSSSTVLKSHLAHVRESELGVRAQPGPSHTLAGRNWPKNERTKEEQEEGGSAEIGARGKESRCGRC